MRRAESLHSQFLHNATSKEVQSKIHHVLTEDLAIRNNFQFIFIFDTHLMLDPCITTGTHNDLIKRVREGYRRFFFRYIQISQLETFFRPFAQ